MSEIEKGDRVRITKDGPHHGKEGTVWAMLGRTMLGRTMSVKIDGCTSSVAFHEDSVVVLPQDDELPAAEAEPEIKVDDRVAVVNVEVSGTIREIVSHYHIEFDDGVFQSGYPASALTVLPPEPTYRVQYRDDAIRLMQTQVVEGDAVTVEHGWCPMDNPQAVATTIRLWAERFDGVDADEARKLIAEPQVLDHVDLADACRCVAARFADGWVAKILWNGFSNTDWFAAKHGRSVNEQAARKLFPGITGPYVERPNDPS